jgi:hypothetical protein
LPGISGVESGKAAPLDGGPPGVELHTVIDELPSGDVGVMVPILLPTIGMPNAVDGIIAGVVLAMDVETVLGVESVGIRAAVMEGAGRTGTAGGGGAGTVEPGIVDKNDEAGCADSVGAGAVVLLDGMVDIGGAAETDGIVAVVPANAVVEVANVEVIGTAAICPVGVEQVTTVPGVVGSDASGTGDSVVPGAPGCVVAEKGLGPLSGDVTIVPGVEARPMAVLPMVETCARPALQPASRIAVVNSKRRIAILPPARSSSPGVCEPRPCCPLPGSPSD